MIRKTSVLALAAVMALALSACGTTKTNTGSSKKTVVDEGSTDPVVARAVTVYKQQCLVCHGSSLEGTNMSAKTNMQKVGSQLSKEQIKDKILSGGGGMIAYKGRLSDEEINALTDWLSTKK